ncbi:MAG: hypothetical protein ACLUNZ_11855 [Evtepia sp.]
MDRMIQDIFPSCYQVAYQPRPPKPEDKCFFFRGRTVLEGWDGEALVLPDYAAVAAHIGQPQFLFIIDETAYYLAEYPNALESPEGYEWHDLRHERSKNPASSASRKPQPIIWRSGTEATDSVVNAGSGPSRTW